MWEKMVSRVHKEAVLESLMLSDATMPCQRRKTVVRTVLGKIWRVVDPQGRSRVVHLHFQVSTLLPVREAWTHKRRDRRTQVSVLLTPGSHAGRKAPATRLSSHGRGAASSGNRTGDTPSSMSQGPERGRHGIKS